MFKEHVTVKLDTVDHS